jgi:hypothetical protein
VTSLILCSSCLRLISSGPRIAEIWGSTPDILLHPNKSCLSDHNTRREIEASWVTAPVVSYASVLTGSVWSALRSVVLTEVEWHSGPVWRNDGERNIQHCHEPNLDALSPVIQDLPTESSGPRAIHGQKCPYWFSVQHVALDNTQNRVCLSVCRSISDMFIHANTNLFFFFQI